MFGGRRSSTTSRPYALSWSSHQQVACRREAQLRGAESASQLVYRAGSSYTYTSGARARAPGGGGGRATRAEQSMPVAGGSHTQVPASHRPAPLQRLRQLDASAGSAAHSAPL